MFTVKLVKGPREEGRPCTHYEVTRVFPDSPVLTDPDMLVNPEDEELLHVYSRGAGIYLQLMPAKEVFHVPSDADVIFIMNDKGATVEILRWNHETKPREVAK